MQKYIIELNIEQAKVIQKALDLYVRLGLGQPEYVHDYIIEAKFKENPYSDQNFITTVENKDFFIESFQNITGFHRGQSRGIYSDELPISFKDAYDIFKAIRHRISWDLNPKGGSTVDFDPPTKVGQYETPKLKKV